MGPKAEQILAKAAGLARINSGELLDLCKRAGWPASRLEGEIQNPAWQDRLSGEAKARDAARAIAALSGRLSDGPRSMLSLGQAGLRERVPAPFYAKLVRWAEARGNVLLLGPTGCGKTITAVWLLVELAAYAERRQDAERDELWHESDHFRVRWDWARAVDLASARQRHKLGEGEAPEVEGAALADVLFVDDLGWEREQDSTVREVLSKRYDMGLTTVVTSGLTQAELSARYGAAFVRRLVESGGRAGVMVDMFPRAK